MADAAEFRALLKCPHCLRDGLIDAAHNGLSCSACGSHIAVVDGIVDFVGGRHDTGLDVDAYDAEKQVTLQASLGLFEHLKRRAGGALSHDRLGNVLEVGAGTGLLTLGMLHDGIFDHAVITDVSTRMLALCRDRVAAEIGDEKRRRVLFATYSGSECILADSRYDLCIGNSVVHHILDYRALFRDIRKALKPRGAAVFVEPSGPYHQAMMHAMIAGLDEVGRAGEDPARLEGFIKDVSLRLSLPPEELAPLEDKHLFWRDGLAEAAQEAGYNDLQVIPSLEDPNGLLGAAGYLKGVGVSQKFFDCFLPVYARHAVQPFCAVDQEDMSGMYLIILRR